MRDFTCPNCGQRLAFENSRCLSCGAALGFSLENMALLVITAGDKSGHAGAVDNTEYQLCANLHLAECNWLVRTADQRQRCVSCALTRIRPRDDDAKAMAAFAIAEKAKRRLVAELYALHLPIVGRDQDGRYGLAFDLLSSRLHSVHTGHVDGVITLDLAEGDDVHRERLRVAMSEPYRTLLGHFRHEIGHYYHYRLVGPSPEYRARFESVFCAPDAGHRGAVDPVEDWAATFAHYLHIRDTMDTSAAFGFAPAGATLDRKALGPSGFDTIIEMWLPLAWALNMENRSMGKQDLYPFVLPPAVLEKLRFIHTVVDEVANTPDRLAGV
ncbi:zinc-binding metallopeptidase family protein [Mycobacterium sp. BMJ-28]